MNATMDMNGVIKLSPETEIEAYALKRWADESAVMGEDLMRAEKFKWRSSALNVDLTVTKKP